MKHAYWIVALFAFMAGLPALADPAAAITSVVAPAGTTSVTTNPDGSLVFVGPLIQALQPYIVSAVGALIVGLAGWVVAILKQKTNIDIDQNILDAFDRAAETQAGIIIAKSESGIMSASIDVHNPMIANAVNTVLARLPAEAARVGMTPEKLADRITGKIGKLQASATVLSPTPVAKP